MGRPLGSVHQAGDIAHPCRKSGEVVDLAALTPIELEGMRSDDTATIFQEPMTSLNPVLTAGRQMTKAMAANREIAPAEARRRAVELMERYC